jgi:hypothetical protein
MSVQFYYDQVFVHLQDRSKRRQKDKGGATTRTSVGKTVKSTRIAFILISGRPIDNDFQIGERDRFTIR